MGRDGHNFQLTLRKNFVTNRDKRLIPPEPRTKPCSLIKEMPMKRNIFIVLLIFLIFFVISFLTNILGPLIPDIIDSFDLSIGLAGFLPFSFFVAYGVMSIPSGILIERYSEKTVLITDLCWLFLPALYLPFFQLFKLHCFYF